MSVVVLSDRIQDGSICLKTIGTRRCTGCVRCLTQHPLECEIDDGFSKIIKSVLDSDELVLSIYPQNERIAPEMRKAIERISNILEAFTDSGGNDPVAEDETSLRTICIDIHGTLDEHSLSEIRGTLLKGTIKKIYVKQK